MLSNSLSQKTNVFSDRIWASVVHYVSFPSFLKKTRKIRILLKKADGLFVVPSAALSPFLRYAPEQLTPPLQSLTQGNFFPIVTHLVQARLRDGKKVHFY